MTDIKKLADKFEELEKEYDKTFDNIEINLDDLPAHRLKFIFAKIAEILVELDNIKKELKGCKKII
jgi:hypothetical protein